MLTGLQSLCDGIGHGQLLGAQLVAAQPPRDAAALPKYAVDCDFVARQVQTLITGKGDWRVPEFASLYGSVL